MSGICDAIPIHQKESVYLTISLHVIVNFHEFHLALFLSLEQKHFPVLVVEWLCSYDL